MPRRTNAKHIVILHIASETPVTLATHPQLEDFHHELCTEHLCSTLAELTFRRCPPAVDGWKLKLMRQ